MTKTPIITGITVSPYHLKETTLNDYMRPITNEGKTIEQAPYNITNDNMINVFASSDIPDEYIVQIPFKKTTDKDFKKYLHANNLPDDLIELFAYAYARAARFIVIIDKKSWGAYCDYRDNNPLPYYDI